MLNDTLAKIEAVIHRLGADHKKKAELSRLLEKLKKEIETLSKTHPEKAQKMQKVELEGLEGTVKEFEATHPDLARTVGDIARLLSGIGI